MEGVVMADEPIAPSTVAPPSRSPTPSHADASPLRAWLYLIRLSFARQARAHLLVWIALGLLALTAFIVLLNTQFDRWNTSYWRSPRRGGPTYSEYLFEVEKAAHLPLD